MTILAGYRVVELGTWVAAPGAGGILADWGADVIKVEAPGGDPMRQLFRLFAGSNRSESPPFAIDNRGKRSVVVDLRSDESADTMRRLLATADVFLTNLRPSALDRLGFGPDQLREAHPALVYAIVSGYGRSGLGADRPGYDIGAFWAYSGIAASLLPPGEAPPAIRPGLGDHATALATVSGILASLLRRERTGTGDIVDVSLLRTGAYCGSWDLAMELHHGRRRPTEPRTEAGNPLVNCYRSGDDRWFWLLGVEGDRHWPRLLDALGRPPELLDPRFADSRGRKKHAEEVIAILDRAFGTSGLAALEESFAAADVWWAPVNSIGQVVDDEVARFAGVFVPVVAGPGAPEHRSVASPVAFAANQVDALGPVPGLGEHTDEVLAELPRLR